jgi:3-oxoacyl-[acyl-carrier-protein] synthase-3
MRLSIPNVRIAAVETCDFTSLPSYDTESLLRAVMPDRYRRYLRSPVSLRLLAELGVAHRHLTHVPGRPLATTRATALDLATSAVRRLRDRRADALADLDALIFVSTSNPNPCNSQAALLAGSHGVAASCYDIKAGCSGGVLGVIQGALLIGAGCDRVLVVMAENLSQLTAADDLRMLLTVGDGAACVLLERAAGRGFLAMIHGSEPGLARAMSVREPFPPSSGASLYRYEAGAADGVREVIADRWRSLVRESVAHADMDVSDLDYWFVHQTHAVQIAGLRQEHGIDESHAPGVVERYGNMGTPTFAVAMAQTFDRLRPGDRYLLEAVGGGVSWASVVAEHG